MEDAILSEVSGHKHLDLPGYLIFTSTNFEAANRYKSDERIVQQREPEQETRRETIQAEVKDVRC